MKQAKQTDQPVKEKTITFRYIGDKRENTVSLPVKDEDNNIVRFRQKPDKSGSPSWVTFYGTECPINEWIEIPFNKHHLVKLKGNHHFEVK